MKQSFVGEIDFVAGKDGLVIALNVRLPDHARGFARTYKLNWQQAGFGAAAREQCTMGMVGLGKEVGDFLGQFAPQSCGGASPATVVAPTAQASAPVATAPAPAAPPVQPPVKRGPGRPRKHPLVAAPETPHVPA